MKFPRRQFLHLAAGAAALPSWPRIAAAADAYPSRTIFVIVGFTPGAAADVTARLLGDGLGADPRSANSGREQAGRRIKHRRRLCRPRPQGRLHALPFNPVHHRQPAHQP